MRSNKKIVWCIPLIAGILLSAGNGTNLSIKEMNAMVEKIKQKRAGVDLKTLDTIRVPFVTIAKDEDSSATVFVQKRRDEKKEKPIEVSAIINKKAFINKKWYKEGDKIYGFEVVHVGNRGVVLKGDYSIKTLFVSLRKEKILQVSERKER